MLVECAAQEGGFQTRAYTNLIEAEKRSLAGKSHAAAVPVHGTRSASDTQSTLNGCSCAMTSRMYACRSSENWSTMKSGSLRHEAFSRAEWNRESPGVYRRVRDCI